MANIHWKYVSPLKQGTEVEALESEYHFSLPDDLKTCIRENNAGVPDPFSFDFCGERDKVFGGLLSFNEGEPDNVYDFLELFENKKKTGLIMFPFGIDPAGNFYCVKDSAIALYDHEADKTYEICKTFTQFLELLHG